MEERGHTYVAIDLKSFYASVECAERGLDPLTTNLVVADASRTEKTICLAVSPSLKAYGVPGRTRLFEVVQREKEINLARRRLAPGHRFTGESYHDPDLRRDPGLSLTYIVAAPRMALYMEYSTRIYNIYLRYVAPDDIHVYSIDEVFIDVTHYLAANRCSAREYAMRMIRDVLSETGITATVGIGTNLYLCKIAMDIMAKKIPPDQDGVRIAELDEMTYRRLLWTHRPLTDFWRVGRGYAAKLEANGLFTMGDVARCSVGTKNDYYNEDLLYRLFGINAELLIDHAWGWEPADIAQIKAYKPTTNSISSGQVLPCPYAYDKAMLIVREMTDALVLDLVEKGLATDQIVLTIMYDVENLLDPAVRKLYHGPVTQDYYGRKVPKHAHGTAKLPQPTSSSRQIIDAAMELYARITDRNLTVRRIYVVANRVVSEDAIGRETAPKQLDLFTDCEAEAKQREEAAAAEAREKSMQKAIITIKSKYGKNALLKGMNLKEGATAADRNMQIGGHKA